MPRPFIKISAYGSRWSADRGSWVPGTVPFDSDLYTELERIRDGYYRDIIEPLHQITDKNEKRAYKAEKLPSITISAVCHTWRKVENVVNHTGFLNIDVDADKNPSVSDWGTLRDQIFSINNVIAAFLSASGKGVTFIVKVNPIIHEDTFNSVLEELYDRLGLIADSSTRDVVRLRFVSYDPECRIKYDIDHIEPITPSPAYWANKNARESAYTRLLPVTEVDSPENFKNAIKRCENKKNFVEGEKHWYLVSLAAYCNYTGMSKEYCEKMTVEHYAPKTSIDISDLLRPIRNVYSTYRSQHATSPPRKPIKTSFGLRRFLLTYIKKEVIKSTSKFIGMRRINGQSSYLIHVPNRTLVYLMWLISPEYSWTCLDIPAEQYFTVEQCKEMIPPNGLLDYVSGKPIWINKKENYPLNW